MKKVARGVLLAVVSVMLGAQPHGWNRSELVEPAGLAALLKDSSRPKPLLIEVSFPVLFRARHIPDAIFAGPGESAQDAGDRPLLRLLPVRPLSQCRARRRGIEKPRVSVGACAVHSNQFCEGLD